MPRKPLSLSARSLGAPLAAALLGLTSAPLAARAEPVSLIDSYKAWSVACDNVRACRAIGADEANLGPYLILDRGPAAFDAPTLRLGLVVTGDQKLLAGPVTLAALDAGGVVLAQLKLTALADGSGFAGTGVAAQTAFAQALANARRVEARQGSTVIATLRVDGSSATLRRMDALQGRSGGKTALVAIGPALASALPAPLPLPRIKAAAPVAQTDLPKELPQVLAERSDIQTCIEDYAPDDDTPWPPAEVARLGPNLYLWSFACGRGAYNFSSKFLLAAADGSKARSPGLGVDDDVLVNAGFDVATQRLGAFNKGRGIADCGEARDYVWDGQTFQLVSRTMMDRCAGVGPDDWFTLYRAEVR